MSNPWDELEGQVLSALRDGVKDFSGELKREAQEFLRNQAAAIAREKWRSLNAPTLDERQIAESNLRHLQGQVQAEVSKLALATTMAAEGLLKKALDVSIGVLVHVGISALTRSL